MMSLFEDLKTGLFAGWKPVLASIIVLLMTVIALTGGWEYFGWDANSIPDPSDGVPTAMKLALAISIVSALALYLLWCWFLSNWIKAKFGLAKNMRPRDFFLHVVLQQFLTLLVAAAASVIIGIVIAITAMTIFMQHGTAWLMAGLSGPDSTATMLGIMICVVVVCFYPVSLLMAYLYLRFSSALAATVKTGIPTSIFRAFGLCAEYVERGKAVRMAHWLVLCLFAVPLLIMAAGLLLGVDWLAHVQVVEQTTRTVTTSGADTVTSTGTKTTYNVASPVIPILQLVALPLVTGLLLIRFLKGNTTDIPVDSLKPSQK